MRRCGFWPEDDISYFHHMLECRRCRAIESAGQTQGVPLRASVQTFSVDRSLSLSVSLSLSLSLSLFSQKQLSPVLFVQMCKLVDQSWLED